MFEKKNIPNLLTLLRLVLAALFFGLLTGYRFDTGVAWLLIPAIVVFIAAAITDAMDGHYARKWQVESKFGRIMDPFCDKVLVLGALVFLAGPGFSSVNNETLSGTPYHRQISSIYPWMVVVMLARELLVTGIRGELEGVGHKFGANVWGKLKMVLQSIVVPVVLFIVYLHDATDQDRSTLVALGLTKIALVYATVVVTVLSGLPYITGAAKVMRSDK